jgi:hypothetical protein
VSSSRPFFVTLTAWGVLSFAVINLLRFVMALRTWAFLDSLPGVMPFYIALTGLTWGAVWSVIFPGLWFGLDWSRKAALIAAPVYALYSWVDRLFFYNVSHDLFRGSPWPFRAFLTVLLLALVYMILTSRRAKSFFRSDK